MNKETTDYYTRIEDLEDELPDRVINDLNQLRDEDDDSVFSSTEINDSFKTKTRGSFYSILGDVTVVFLITVFILNKRFIKFIGDYDVNLPKNVIMAIISSLLYSIYKIILYVY